MAGGGWREVKNLQHRPIKNRRPTGSILPLLFISLPDQNLVLKNMPDFQPNVNIVNHFAFAFVVVVFVHQKAESCVVVVGSLHNIRL